MKEILKFDFSPYAKVYWNEELKTMRCEWLKLFGNMDTLKSIPMKMLEEIEKLKGDTLIIDSYNSQGVISKELLQYIDNEVNPMSVKCGVTKILTILPKALGFAAKSIEMVQEKKDEMQFNANFSTLEECYSWVAQQAKVEES